MRKLLAFFTGLFLAGAVFAAPPLLQDINGNQYTPAYAGALGGISVSTDPLGIMADTFDGASFDANRWTAAGTVPPTVSTSSARVNPGTAASASSSLVSIPTFPFLGGQQETGFQIQLETPLATGNHRFFGLGTQPGSWTAATPIQDGAGIEVDTSGVVRFSVYAAGVRTATTIITGQLADGVTHGVLISRRPNLNLLYIDNFFTPITLSAATTIAVPNVEALPIRVHSINGLSTTVGTPTVAFSDFAQLDTSHPTASLSDGVYPFRAQTVYPSGAGFTGLVNTEGQRATYRYAVQAFAPVATPTAFLVIAGSATKVTRIKRITIGGVATATGNMQLQVSRWSTAGTLGSAVLTALPAVKGDTTDAAATAVVSTVGTANYTTQGTGNGNLLAAERITLTTVATGAAQALVYDFATRNDKPIVLRGVTDILALSGAGSAVPAGGVLDIEIETEEDTY